jgi:hypothetical protein
MIVARRGVAPNVAVDILSPVLPGSGRAALPVRASETFDQAVFIYGRVEVALCPSTRS